MMIPQVARKLISIADLPQGSTLLDPFCGSGTSLVEARAAGLHTVGFDINPLARMISRAKVRKYDVRRLRTSWAMLSGTLRDGINGAAPDDSDKLEVDRAGDWFSPRTMDEVTGLLSIIRSEYALGTWYRQFFEVALSDCLRAVSYQRSKEYKLWRRPEDERGYVPLLPVFTNRVERNISGAEAFATELASHPRTAYRVADNNSVFSAGRSHLPVQQKGVDMILTSPPYGDSETTMSYAQFSWLSNTILGLNPEPPGRLDREMMGGRPNGGDLTGCHALDAVIEEIGEENPRRANEVASFYLDYRASIASTSSLVNEGGFACYVVGNRRVGGRILPTDVFTEWALESEGFELQVETFSREIPSKRLPRKNSPSNTSGEKGATMNHERIVISRKVG